MAGLWPCVHIKDLIECKHCKRCFHSQSSQQNSEGVIALFFFIKRWVFYVDAIGHISICVHTHLNVYMCKHVTYLEVSRYSLEQYIGCISRQAFNCYCSLLQV